MHKRTVKETLIVLAVLQGLVTFIPTENMWLLRTVCAWVALFWFALSWGLDRTLEKNDVDNL